MLRGLGVSPGLEEGRTGVDERQDGIMDLKADGDSLTVSRLRWRPQLTALFPPTPRRPMPRADS